VNNVIGCKASSCYLIEKWQESLKVVAVDDSDISFSSECLCSTKPTKACAKNYNFGQL
jgi:hypothetical protein